MALGMIVLLPAIAAGGPAPLSVDAIRVLKISPRDGRAVIKTPDGEMKVIKAGDVLRAEGKTRSGFRVAGPEKEDTNGELRVIAIAKDRIVFEEGRGVEAEKVIIRMEDGGKKQVIERMRKTGGKRPQLHVVK